MYIKSFFYNAPDGVHYPDAMSGVKYTYGMDFNEYLESQKGTLLRAEWNLEEGLVKYQEFIHPEQDTIACALIEASYVGSYTAKCNMHYMACGVEQQIVVPLIIKVY